MFRGGVGRPDGSLPFERRRKQGAGRAGRFCLPEARSGLLSRQMKLSAGNYFGIKRLEVRLGDLILSECSYAPGAELPSHSHHNGYLILALEGEQLERL